MASSELLRCVALVRTDVSEELSTTIIRVTRIGELGTTVFLRSVRRLLVTANVFPGTQIVVTLMMEALHSSETSDLTRAARLNIPEDSILPFFVGIGVKTSDLTRPQCFYVEVISYRRPGSHCDRLSVPIMSPNAKS
jgi:hypothetical protein